MRLDCHAIRAPAPGGDPRLPRRRAARPARLPRALDGPHGRAARPGRRAATRRATSAGRGRCEFGGGGGPAAEQIVIDQELAAAGAPEFANVVGLDVLGPSLLRFGTDEQRRRHIPAILVGRGDLVPGVLRAGRRSDLASLRTRAEEHGDHYVVSGQKTWVSWGQFARWCGVLARTDDAAPEAPGHLHARSSTCARPASNCAR